MRVSIFSQLSELFSLSDEEVMLRVQKQNDPRAFALLVRRWQTRTERLCARLTGDVHRGEDIAQDVFMHVFVHRNEYKHKASFATYLRRIALNACYDEGRRVKRQRKSSLSDNNGRENICDWVLLKSKRSPEMIAAEQERAELVRKALFQLPEHYRSVVILRHYEGLRFREIAEVLDIPAGTVKSRMAEALSRLGHLLKPVLNEETVRPANRQGVGKANGKEVL